MIKFLLKCLEFFTNESSVYMIGTRAPMSGVYRSEDEYIPLAMGERFPPANTCWRLVVQL